MAVLEALEPAVRQRKEQPHRQAGDADDDRPQPHAGADGHDGPRHEQRQAGGVDGGGAGLEAEAHAAPAGVAELEALGAREQHRAKRVEHRQHREAGALGPLERMAVADQQRQRQHAADQDAARIAVEIEAVARQQRVPREPARLAALGPGGVDAQRRQRQQGIDDPDAEILAAGAGELQSLLMQLREQAGGHRPGLLRRRGDRRLEDRRARRRRHRRRRCGWRCLGQQLQLDLVLDQSLFSQAVLARARV